MPALPQGLVMMSWMMRHLWFDAEDETLNQTRGTPRVGPAWQTDNL